MISNISADESYLNPLQTSGKGLVKHEPSVVSRVLTSDPKVVEGLIESYHLAEGSPDSSGPHSYDTGPWDQGHWANRQEK